MNQNPPARNLLNTKQHFEILNGLRGVAAIAVVIFHFMEIAVPDYHKNFIAHAYLAVDFFFCLSGFVIAFAYDGKFDKIQAGTFLKLRLIRLHPLVIIGAVLGLISFIFDPYSSLQTVYGWGKTTIMFVTSCLMIPYPVVHERYLNLFHLNPPSWSLFWEYVANLAYALILVRLKNKGLSILTIIAAIMLFIESYSSNYLGVGWGGDTFRGGGVRVFYSFLAGMLTYRAGWIIRSKLGLVSTAILLMIALVFPYSDKINWLSDPIIVVFYFPFIIALGAGARLSQKFKSICRFAGDISYPLYMTHYGFIWIFFSYVEKFKPSMRDMTIVMTIGTILLILFAYIVMVYLDQPIRNYLKNRLKNNSSLSIGGELSKN